MADTTSTAAGWRVVDDAVTAWFEAPSLRAGAALAARLVDLPGDVLVDVRATGVRVRVGSDEHAGAVWAAARDLGLTADPTALQRVSVVVESPDPAAVRPFWQGVLGYASTDDGGLDDPLRRDPPLRFRPSTESRPLRNRLHLDVVRPEAVAEHVRPGEPYGAFGVCHADTDGNEVDLVPGGPLGDAPGTSDWHAVFGGVACYRVESSAQQRDLVSTAAALADDAGFPLLVDVRPGLVVLDTGKDRWEADAHRLDVDFPALAARLQAAARDLGATADPGLPRFVQLFLDAADVAAVRAFWLAVLRYVPDGRSALDDVVDPRWLNPVLAFQEIDAADTERRRQRNRLHVELAVPADATGARVASALDAGGRLLDESPGRWRLADPEGNELVVVAG